MSPHQIHQPKMIRLNITYGLEQEVLYVRNTVKKIPWYLEQGYPLESIRLPKGISQDSTEKDIRVSLQAEYIEADYAACATALEHSWEEIAEGFQAVRGESAFHVNDAYSIILTKYGTGGNYNVKKSSVTVRVEAEPQPKTIGIIVHEIMHIAIQHLIDRYHVKHWHKERLVDLLLEQFFQGLKKMQPIKEDVSAVDRAFKEFMPDIEVVAREVGDTVTS